MKKPKIILTYITTISLIPFVLAGCSKKSECEIPARHVHKYVRQVNSDISIEKYLDDETLSKLSGYNWTNEYIEINKKDEEFYKTISGMMVGEDNWNYLYYTMSTSRDYLEFWYEYDTTDIITSTDEDGNTTTETVTTHHEGWHRNSHDSDNTGKFRIVHTRYYGYKVIYENGKFTLKRSPEVDDVREIMNEYPYYHDDFKTLVTQTYKISKYELSSLDPYDSRYNTFNHPDLSNRSKDLNGSYVYTKK